MARSRNIKPSIMDNEELAELPALTRLLFIYMWMLADREGRLEDRPGRIKKQALGYDDGNADGMLSELAKAGFIERYEAGGLKVIQIINFHKHQTPHVREAASELPEKEQSTTKVVPCTERGDDETSPRSPDSPFLIPDSLIPDSLTQEAQPSRAGLVCRLMKSKGISDVSPGHPELLMLIEAGATDDEFAFAATTAAGKSKGFTYALGTLKGTRKQAAEAAKTAPQGPLPSAQPPPNTVPSKAADVTARLLEEQAAHAAQAVKGPEAQQRLAEIKAKLTRAA